MGWEEKEEWTGKQNEASLRVSCLYTAVFRHGGTPVASECAGLFVVLCVGEGTGEFSRRIKCTCGSRPTCDTGGNKRLKIDASNCNFLRWVKHVYSRENSVSRNQSSSGYSNKNILRILTSMCLLPSKTSKHVEFCVLGNVYFCARNKVIPRHPYYTGSFRMYSDFTTEATQMFYSCENNFLPTPFLYWRHKVMLHQKPIAKLCNCLCDNNNRKDF